MQLAKYSFNQLLMLVGILLPVLGWMMKTRIHSSPMISYLDDTQLTSELKDLDVLILGGTEGIGSALAHELHRRGSRLTITGATKANLRQLPKGAEFILANTSTMRGAQELGGQLLEGRQFDTVVFAGGFVPRPLIFTAGEGAEEDLETSYLSRFIVLQELIKRDAFVGRKRVYVLGYPGEDPLLAAFEDMWFGWPDYKNIPPNINTILFNDALVKEAARRYPDLHVYGVNPGFLNRGGASDVDWAHRSLFSRLLEWILTIGMKSPESYARNTLVQIVASPQLEEKSGAYISDQFEDLPPKRWFSKEENRKQVWENSEKLVFKALG